MNRITTPDATPLDEARSAIAAVRSLRIRDALGQLPAGRRIADAEDEALAAIRDAQASAADTAALLDELWRPLDAHELERPRGWDSPEAQAAVASEPTLADALEHVLGAIASDELDDAACARLALALDQRAYREVAGAQAALASEGRPVACLDYTPLLRATPAALQALREEHGADTPF